MSNPVMARTEITRTTLKRLFGLSGNRCAFPGCGQQMVATDGTVIGQICHIEAAEKGGERYNPDQTDPERADYLNLILLCKKHHEETDNVIIYTVSKLKEMKLMHESQNSAQPYQISAETLERAAEIANAIQYNINSGSGTLIAPQKGDVHVHGLTLSDGMVLFKELFANNMPKLKEEAQRIAEERCQKFYEEFSKKAARHKIGEVEFSKFAEPDAQATLASAIRVAATKSSDTIRETLATLLVNRLKYEEQDLKSIVISEAMATLPKLTNNQLRILALTFILKYIKFGDIWSWSALERAFEKHAVPFLAVTVTSSDLQHLEYAGCGSISVAETNSELIVNHNYPWLRFKPIPSILVSRLSPDAFVTLTQFGKMDENGSYFISAQRVDWQAWLREKGIGAETVKELEALYAPDPWPPNLNSNSPCMRAFRLMDSHLTELNLTSVGMLLGIVIAEQVTGGAFKIENWIS